MIEFSALPELHLSVRRLQDAYNTLVKGITEFDSGTDPNPTLDDAITKAEPYFEHPRIEGDRRDSSNSSVAEMILSAAEAFKRLYSYETEPKEDDLQMAKNEFDRLNAIRGYFNSNEPLRNVVGEIRLAIAQRIGLDGSIDSVVADISPAGGRQSYVAGKVAANRGVTMEALNRFRAAYEADPNNATRRDAYIKAIEARTAEVNSIGINTYATVLPAITADFQKGVDRFSHGYDTFHPSGVNESARAIFTNIADTLLVATPATPLTAEQQNMKVEALKYLARIAGSQRDFNNALARLNEALAIKEVKEVYQLQAQYVKEMRR